MDTYFGCHNHTMYSNIRLLDCINRPEELIKKAYDLGLNGIAITDHECLSSHMEINQFMKNFNKEHPEFTVALGNEIYLTDTRDNGQKYYHFLLIAKDEIGHRALRELSSIAWTNSYMDRRMERVPTLKSELVEIVQKYKGHLIATTACMGGELSTLITLLINARNKIDYEKQMFYNNQISNFIDYCINLFGDDFYIECAPSLKADQIAVNIELYNISNTYNIPITVGTDAHYMTIEDRSIHKAYLNSKEGEREVDDFYEFARLMSPTECRHLLKHSYSDIIVDKIFKNSLEIQEKIKWYSLERKQIIPKVEVINYPYFDIDTNELKCDFSIINSLLNSNEIQERYWINECLNGLKEKKLYNIEYLSRLETEAKIIKQIGEQLGDCLFAYFNTFKHYIDLFWECGSIVGPGRGSATGFLSNYLLGITQLDPIRWGLPYWRFLNEARAELPSLLLILGSCKKRTLTIA